MKKQIVTAIAAVSLCATVFAPATAGGLFGEGGLIRGDVGRFMDKHVEKPILTPLARTTVVVAGATVGAAYGGKIGAVLGAGVGQAINEAVGPGKSAGSQQVAAVETGSTCSTSAIGNWVMTTPLPLGTECFVKLQNGSQVTGKTIK